MSVLEARDLAAIAAAGPQEQAAVVAVLVESLARLGEQVETLAAEVAELQRQSFTRCR